MAIPPAGEPGRRGSTPARPPEADPDAAGSSAPRRDDASPRGTDDPSEVPLHGGNASEAVVRVGGTVRKPWTPATPHVVAVAEAVRAAGVDVPRHHGRDARGRQVIEFVPGELAMDHPERTRARLGEIGALVRRIHDAAATHRPDPDAVWDAILPPPQVPPGEGLICHGDLTPWNLLLGERLVFIDWDGAGPSTRLWDLAYAAQAFTLNDPAADPGAAVAALSTFLDGYGADEDLRCRLPETLVLRARAMHDMLESSHWHGIEPWATMFATGHGAHWDGVARHLDRHRSLIAEAIRGTAAPR